jgi:glutathione S-transferase
MVVAAGGTMTAETGGEIPVLWQLRFSHFNEKARWALDYKRIPHRRHSLAPGSHPRRARKLWGGRTTPVLQIGSDAIGDTTEIIAELERRYPEHPLYPAGEAERRRALELEDYFDRELGPAIRSAAFHAILPYRSITVPLTAQGLGAGVHFSFNASYPLLKRAVARSVNAREADAGPARRKTVAALDRLEAELGGGEYMVGERFSVADLTAAALFFPMVWPSQFPYDPPTSIPPEWEEFVAPLSGRPGFLWVGEMFRRHRGDSAEVA